MDKEVKNLLERRLALAAELKRAKDKIAVAKQTAQDLVKRIDDSKGKKQKGFLEEDLRYVLQGLVDYL